jgi:hypothetical protein
MRAAPDRASPRNPSRWGEWALRRDSICCLEAYMRSEVSVRALSPDSRSRLFVIVTTRGLGVVAERRFDPVP